MKRKRTSPLKQTSIASFFSQPRPRPETPKKLKDDLENDGSPDVIAATPPSKLEKTSKAKTSLRYKKVEVQVDSAYSENTPPEEEHSPIRIKTPLKGSPLKQSNHQNELFDDFDDDFGFDEVICDSLSFEKCVKARVVSLIQGHLQKTLTVENGQGQGHVVLRDMWAFSLDAEPGDAVSVVAINKDGEWLVDAQNGYVCLFPDFLVSSTSISGAIFCRRKGILSTIFKGLDGDNKVMAIGSLAHEMLQKALMEPKCSKSSVQRIMTSLLSMPSNIRLLYSTGVTEEIAKQDLSTFIPHIVRFIQTYVTKELKPSGKNFQGSIEKIIDIEESVSSANLGLKGRLDITANIKLNGVVRRMPIEVKTGRASFSNEHKSQVILYTLLMTDMGFDVTTGLLLYIGQGLMETVEANRAQIRDIFLLRNDYVKYARKFDPANLPEPIRFEKGCQNCPYVDVCSIYLSNEDNYPVKKIAKPLDPTHVEYFHVWNKMLLLECEEEDGLPIKIEGVLESGFEELKDGFKYNFVKPDIESRLYEGAFVRVSSACGRIVDLSTLSVSVVFEKKFTGTEGSKYEIEGYQSTLLSRYMSNLGHLLSEECESLRKIIIDKTPAKFAPKMSKKLLTPECMKVLSALNEQQQRAVLKTLVSENYLLVEGPPGTGKTQTVAALVKVLTLLNKSVLLCAHTHSAVDNILRRLSDVQFLRLGSLANIPKELHGKAYGTLCENVCNLTQMEAILNRPVVASTCLGLDADIIARRKFDVCIIDECSQVLQPEVLKPLFAADKFVLIGDPKQLRPVVKNLEAQKMGMTESIFERLFNKESVVSLTKQYRMNKTIMDVANGVAYNGLLEGGSKKVLESSLKIKVNEKWLTKILACDVMFVDTCDLLTKTDKTFGCENEIEGNLVAFLVRKVLKAGVKDIGVMAPFRAQVRRLASCLPPGIEVNTVDQYQGRDKDCVFISCTRQDRVEGKGGEYELLNDMRRLTVAITRAKLKLIIIGDLNTMKRYETFERLFSVLVADQFYKVVEGVDDFSWSLFGINE